MTHSYKETFLTVCFVSHTCTHTYTTHHFELQHSEHVEVEVCDSTISQKSALQPFYIENRVASRLLRNFTIS